MVFCLVEHSDLADGMEERTASRYSREEGHDSDIVVYNFLEPFPEIIFVDTATDLAGFRAPPAETVRLKSATYKLHGGTCFVNNNHYHAIIHQPQGWIDIDSMTTPKPLFSDFIPSLPHTIPIFGWMIYEREH